MEATGQRLCIHQRNYRQKHSWHSAPEKERKRLRSMKTCRNWKDNTFPIIAKDGTRIDVDTKLRKEDGITRMPHRVSRGVTERRFENALQSERRLNEANTLQDGSWTGHRYKPSFMVRCHLWNIWDDPLQFGATYAFKCRILMTERVIRHILRLWKAPYQIEHRLLMADGR